ncbi:hypothetical protein Q0F98_00760 [Paenibacillus amylolyticus]|nr:hypothetical protein Q0F98_00760 [Paenibacillus amylolyticus]
MIEQGISDHLLKFEDLEQALILFCEQIIASANGSSDYKALIRLVMVEAANLQTRFLKGWITQLKRGLSGGLQNLKKTDCSM